MASLSFPDVTWGDTLRPIRYSAQHADTLELVEWESGTITILTLSGDIVVDAVAMEVAGDDDEELRWTPVWGDDDDEISQPSFAERSVIYVVQINGVAAGEPSTANTQLSAERSWRILRRL